MVFVCIETEKPIDHLIKMHTRSAARSQAPGVPEIVTLDSSDEDDNDVVEIDISSDNATTSTAQEQSRVNESVILETPVNVQEAKPSKPEGDHSLGQPSQSEVSFEDYPYNLKLKRFSKFEQYETTWKTRLNVALKDLIEELAKSNKDLVLLRRRDSSNEKESVPLDGTPSSLGLDSGTILDAIVIPAQSNKTTPSDHATIQCKPSIDPNTISLKLQDGQRKHLREYKIGKNEPLKLLKERYSQDFNIDLNRMKLSFDGETVNDDDTSDGLDIEDGCVIDVIVK